ncbi:maleylpyruvate isomerase family mycothiol-dependent enzyme [Saccharothrix sp. NPDC042600]|uniref:maleylpyruvate isomerase family mycothiol-dependent enzyme n=1 Tax=Saccharothrix TaxID=2071 RepID=UPI0033D1E05C|nr:TIGR03084 family metal-binding protein [Saccharothrix mutabilis subsp. capreolus]
MTGPDEMGFGQRGFAAVLGALAAARSPRLPPEVAGGGAWADELADLADEQRAFAALLDALASADWERPSAAPGWTVRDQVAHLADTEEVAADTLLDGPRAFRRALGGFATAEDFTAAGCRRADGMSPTDLVSWWAGAAARTREALGRRDPQERVAWGFGLSARVFATARLMEHWAHGLDIADALGLPVPETPRLLRVAELGLATLRYALARAGTRWPAGHTLRLELRAHDGALHRLGPEDATDVLRGPLAAWCRTATRRAGGRRPFETDGPLAALATTHARAYL